MNYIKIDRLDNEDDKINESKEINLSSFEVKSFVKKILNDKIEIKLSSSENILSISTEIKNKKYRLTLTKEELENSYIYFKQFSTFKQILKSFSKIIEINNDILIKEKEIEIKFKNIIDEDIIIKIPEDLIDINFIYLKLKKLEVEKSKDFQQPKEKESKEEKLSEEGLGKDAIETVMEKGRCSRSTAIRALRAHNGDPVEALLEVGQ